MSEQDLNAALVRRLRNHARDTRKLGDAVGEGAKPTVGNPVEVKRNYGLAADDMLNAADMLESMAFRSSLIGRLQARVAAVRHVIDYGFPRDLAHGEKCSHGRYSAEDCIGCYDEALLAALDPASADRSPEGQDVTGGLIGEADESAVPNEDSADAQ